MTMKVSYRIEAPVEKVFDYFKDPAVQTPGMEVLDAKTTQEGVGTYLNWRLKVPGLPWQGWEIITDLEPNKHITEKSSSAIVGTWEYTFEPEGSGTKVTLEHRPRSFWGLPPLSTLVDYGTTRMSRVYIGHVKAELEAHTPPPRKRVTTARPKRAAGH